MRTDGINYPDPVPVGYCAMCGDPIYWGDFVFETKYGELLHADGLYREYHEKDTNEILRLTCAETWALEQGNLCEMVEGAGMVMKQW